MKITVNFDGSCNPNPSGEMGIGVTISNFGEKIHSHSGSFEPNPINTNNVAEYLALEYALTWLIENGHQKSQVTIKGDSNLVIKQMSDLWKLKNGAYLQTAYNCREKIALFSDIRFGWIPREKNSQCDDLSKIQTAKPNKITADKSLLSQGVNVVSFKQHNPKEKDSRREAILLNTKDFLIPIEVEVKGSTEEGFTCNLKGRPEISVSGNDEMDLKRRLTTKVGELLNK